MRLCPIFIFGVLTGITRTKLDLNMAAGHLTGQTLVIAGGMEGRLLWQSEEIDPGIA